MRFTPREHFTYFRLVFWRLHRLLSSDDLTCKLFSTDATVTSAPARTNVSIIVTVSNSSEPLATGTNTFRRERTTLELKLLIFFSFAAILQHRLKGVYLKLMCTDYVAATKSTFSPFGRRRHHVTGSRKKHSLARRYASLSVRIMKICRYFIMKDLFMRLNGL
jgi:hypothetical protein